MPVPVGPIRLVCKTCGWHKTIVAQSDVVFVPSNCPKCGGEDLACEPVGALERIVSSIFMRASKVINR